MLFIIFSMVYLAVFQKDLLEAIHFSVAKGNSDFHIVPAAIIVTVILLILEWGLNLLMRLRGSVKALAYLPSFLGLITMTGFGRDVYMGRKKIQTGSQSGYFEHDYMEHCPDAGNEYCHDVPW